MHAPNPHHGVIAAATRLLSATDFEVRRSCIGASPDVAGQRVRGTCAGAHLCTPGDTRVAGLLLRRPGGASDYDLHLYPVSYVPRPISVICRMSDCVLSYVVYLAGGCRLLIDWSLGLLGLLSAFWSGSCRALTCTLRCFLVRAVAVLRPAPKCYATACSNSVLCAEFHTCRWASTCAGTRSWRVFTSRAVPPRSTASCGGHPPHRYGSRKQ